MNVENIEIEGTAEPTFEALVDGVASTNGGVLGDKVAAHADYQQKVNASWWGILD